MAAYNEASTKRRKEKENEIGWKEKEIRSNSLTLDLKEDKFKGSGKEQE